MRALAPIVVVVVAVLVASTAGAAPSPVTCESIVTPTGTFEWRPKRVVLGVLAVPPRHIPQTVAQRAGRWRYSSKSGLVVKANSPEVEVVVPRTWRDRVAIAWGDADVGSALRIASCPPSSALGDWNPYAGGFYLRSPAACLPLTFRAGGRSATVRFGVGRRCS